MPGAAGWLGSKLDQSAAMLRSVAEDWLPSRKLDAKLHELDMRGRCRPQRQAREVRRRRHSAFGERGWL
jgi:hypothetical protein